MQNAAPLALAGLCLGIAMAGLCATLTAHHKTRERMSLALVYGAFGGIVAFPLVSTFSQTLFLFYVPAVLVMLLMLPPAVYHFVAAKTATEPTARVPWRDLVLPIVGCLVCLGFWGLPLKVKADLFIAGTLPPGLLPAGLALVTFGLILCWLVASCLYLTAILRRLAIYRAHLRQLYSNVDKRDCVGLIGSWVCSP